MEYLFVVGVVQALFTTVFLASKPKRALSDLVLAAWMIFIALPMIDILAMHLWPDLHVPILQSDLIYPLTYGPFMWLYVRAVTGAISRISRQDLMHFLPFSLVSLVQIVTGLAPPLPNPDHMVFDTSTRLVGAVNLVLILSYSWAVAQRLSQHGLKVNQHFSNLPNRVTLKWLFWLIAGFSAVSLLLFLGSLLSLPAVLHVHLPAKIAILFGLSFYGLRQNQVFDHKQEPSAQDRSDPQDPEPILTEPQGGSEDSKKRYSRSGLTEERAERILTRLEAYMKTARPYLSADLTITDLAKQMSVPRHHLTEVISTRHEKSFYIFVNEYRIAAIKQAMESPENANATLLELAYASGFNSKSPFNAAFKQLTGMTPSQYRRQLR
ncbi:AraC family transcriptional regulator [Pseudophaeobacter sp. EL27]|uniref:helix-turn-helix domain-containing protein n=1 Tax=Pseudophaeobacter sp. EL27 TaxID=2107580 RepID=UPI0013C3EBAF|nr:AraC family transcriptional regulator [Pseudophaeobacter sp. EL27]